MTLSISPSQDAAFISLKAFLENILPPGTPVFQGQENRVPEVPEGDFVTFFPVRRDRIETNVDSFQDRAGKGIILDDQMTVTVMLAGKFQAGNQITGPGVAAGTRIVSGPVDGGIGVYTVTPGGQNIIVTTIFQGGGGQYMMPTKLTIQLDVHGDNSADNAQIIATMFRDEYAVDFFAAIAPDPVPLYADDPRQMPFLNDQQQVENRWMIDALLQTNTIVQAPQQFADRVAVDLINVDVEYPPPPQSPAIGFMTIGDSPIEHQNS